VILELLSHDRIKLDFKKVKQSHNTPMKVQGEERMYSFYSFTTLALDGGEFSASFPGCALLLGGKGLVPIGQEAGWATESRGKISCLCWGSNLDRKVVQSVARHYTD
jgi:hypothetical protein